MSNETINDVTIANNSFSQLFEGINLQGGGAGASNSVIQDVIISNNSFSQMTSNGTSAVELGDLGTNNIVQNVQIIQNTFTGNLQGVVADINGTSSSVQNTIIARNVFVGNLQALGIVAGVNSDSDSNTVINTQIVDNLIDLTGYEGQGSATIQIIDSQSGGTNDKVTGVSFINNTIYNGTSGSPSGWGVWVTSSGGVTGVSIWNSIFWGNESTAPLSGITSGQVSYSIIDQSGFPNGVNGNINSDPLFVNSTSGEFGLQSGSPARGAGTSTGAPSIDLDCQSRASPPSIGAYELNGPNVCGTLQVSPATDVAATGTRGGPFSPASFNYALSTSLGTANFSISGLPSWLNASVTSGTVTTSPTTVTFTVNTSANSLSAGIYGPSVLTIANTTSGLGTQFLTATLTVVGLSDTHDFNGDGYSDIAWRGPTGDVAIWLMNGTQILSGPDLGNVPTNWTIVGQRQLNNSGYADLLWRGPTGDLSIWFMNGTQILSTADFGTIPTNWSIVGTSAYNASTGYAELFWRDTAGDLAIWQINGTQILAAPLLGNVPPAG